MLQNVLCKSDHDPFPWAIHTLYEGVIYYNNLIWETCPTCSKGDVLINLAKELNKLQIRSGNQLPNQGSTPARP